jgi:UDP-N-acetyl-D-glucosamine dehydrogenase
MKVCIVGYGYYAERNIEFYQSKHNVTLLVPISITVEESMELRQRTSVPIYYEFETDAVKFCDVYIICLELKYDSGTQSIDLDPLSDVSQALRRNIREGSTILLETTVGVGVTRKMFTGMNFHCSHSPTVFNPNNITCPPHSQPKLIGGLDPESEQLAMQFYEPVYDHVVCTGSPEVSEAAIMLKCAKKTVEEALVNEFSDFCDTVPDLDIHKVIDATTVGDRDPQVVLPWIGRSIDMDSHHLISSTVVNKSLKIWPVLSTASDQLMARPGKIYRSIVNKYARGKFDNLHKLAFLVVGLGSVMGSPDTKYSPVMNIINKLELEGAKVDKYDMFIEEYEELPDMKHNSGKPKYDGILVMHPYNPQIWKKHKQTTFYCRH